MPNKLFYAWQTNPVGINQPLKGVEVKECVIPSVMQSTTGKYGEACKTTGRGGKVLGMR
jgi:hypothetical protein